jgi:AcrR family transcriptional regulator
MDEGAGEKRVGRRPDPGRRAELQARLVDYVLEHGVADLSLRPLAEALGTSVYSLVYHFGSKAAVLAAALEGAEERQRAVFAAWAEQERNDAALSGLLVRFWEWMSSEGMRPYHRLFFEAYGLALRDAGRVPGFLESSVAPWRDLAGQVVESTGMAQADSEVVATLMVSSVAGLLLELLATGDLDRTTRTMHVVAGQIETYVRDRAPSLDSARAKS